jgi:SAM-dependent methyltransferase
MIVEKSMTSITDFYDPYLYNLGVGDADSGNTLAYYQEKIGPPPQRVLEIGAGTGRIAIPLLLLGHEITAVDRSSRMLDSFRHDARLFLPGGSNLVVVCSPFSARGDERPVNVAIAPDDFLLHLTAIGELRKFFHDLTTWLPEGGRFLTDIRPREPVNLQTTAHPPYILRSFGLVQDKSRDDENAYHNVVYWEAYNEVTQILKTTCQYQTLNATGEVTRTYFRVLCQRVHTNVEIKQAAKDAGFQLIEHTERNSASVSTERLIGGSFEFRL